MWTEMPVDVVLEAECGGYDAELEEQSGEAGLKGGLGGRREVQLDWRVRSEMSVIDEAARSVAAKKNVALAWGKGDAVNESKTYVKIPALRLSLPRTRPSPCWCDEVVREALGAGGSRQVRSNGLGGWVVGGWRRRRNVGGGGKVRLDVEAQGRHRHRG
jgi:hypothetical protein